MTDEFDYDEAAARYRSEFLTKVQAVSLVLRSRLRLA